MASLLHRFRRDVVWMTATGSRLSHRPLHGRRLATVRRSCRGGTTQLVLWRYPSPVARGRLRQWNIEPVPATGWSEGRRCPPRRHSEASLYPAPPLPWRAGTSKVRGAAGRGRCDADDDARRPTAASRTRPWTDASRAASEHFDLRQWTTTSAAVLTGRMWSARSWRVGRLGAAVSSDGVLMPSAAEPDTQSNSSSWSTCRLSASTADTNNVHTRCFIEKDPLFVFSYLTRIYTSRAHECDRRQTTDRPRYGEMRHHSRNRLYCKKRFCLTVIH